MTMNENMKLWKYSGTFLVITGAIHTVYALLLGKEDFTDMIKDGLINSTDDSYSRAFALWFLVCGIILILWGLTLQYYIKKEQKPAPLILGYCILAFAVVGCIIEPISGFWLFLPQALVIIAANRKGTYNRQHYEYNISKRTTSIHPTNYSVFTASFINLVQFILSGIKL